MYSDRDRSLKKGAGNFFAGCIDFIILKSKTNWDQVWQVWW